MGENKIKRLVAFWLSIAMFAGSIYTSNNYNTLADQTSLKLLESFKAENGKSGNSINSLDGIKAVKATAANSGEITDGDVIDDTTTNSNALIEGKLATASNANAIARLTSSGEKIVVDKINSSIEYINSISGSIEDVSDFGIGKIGTNHLMLRCTVDVKNDFPIDRIDDIGAEIIVPKGFKIYNFEVPEDELGWKGEYVLNDNKDEYSGGIIKLQCQAHLTDKLIVTFEIFQNAQILINNLSTTHIFNFPLNLYADYSTASPALIVASSGDEKTTELEFPEADNSDPIWSVTVERNGLKLKPSDFSSNGYNASEDAYYDNTYLYNSASKFNSGLVVKYTKTRGYIADNTLFKFMPEKLPLYDNKYTIAARYTDEYGNVVSIYSRERVINGQFKFMAAQESNTFTAVSGATPQNSTYADIFYNAGTFEIRVIPNILYNKLYYNTANVFPMEFESDYPTAVETISNHNAGASAGGEGEKIKIIISDGSEDAGEFKIKSASAADSELKEVYQVGTTKTYNDIEEQYIRLTYEKVAANWTPYNHFSLTVEYEEASGDYPEALTPVKLEALKTSADYGLTYKIHIKNAKTGDERIETIIGMKNHTDCYDYTVADPSKEKIVGRGITAWDGTKNLSKTEYVKKIEIVKDIVTDSKFRGSCELAKTILRAQHHTIDGEDTNIPNNTKVKLVATVETANVTWGPYVQEILAIEDLEKMGDTLELLEADAQLEMAVNNATLENGILGTYTLKKYPLTDVDEDDLPAVVLSGDGITLTDRVSATGQSLLYIVYKDDSGDDVVVDLTDRSKNSKGVLASDYIIEATGDYKDSIKYNKEYVLKKSKDIPTASLKTPYRLIGYGLDTDTKLYNLTELFEDLEIPYATEIVLRQDFVKDWQPKDMEGETWSKCFYANAIKPGYLNYDNLVKINSNPEKGEVNLESVQLTYTSKLYCRASDWLNKKATCSNSEKHGEQTKKEQNITKIIYGNIVRDFAIDQSAWNVDECNTLSEAPGVIGYRYRRGTNGVYRLVEISPGTKDGRWITPKRFNETQIDYDNVVYDFSGTSKEFLSLVSGVALDFNDDYSLFLIDIEYTTSDGKVHLMSNCLFDVGKVTSGTNDDMFEGHVNLEIDEGTYLTDIKIKVSNEGYIWFNERDNGGKNMQPQFPGVYLYRNDKTAVMPKTYPSDSTKKIGYQGNVDSDGAIYDQHNVKCTVTYTDIFNKAMDPIVIEGDSSRISNTKFTVNQGDISSISYELAEDTSSRPIRRGDVLNVSLKDSLNISPGNMDVELRPVIYYAIDKDFTPNTANIKGLEEGTKAFFYPAGEGDGYSGSEDYGYLVIDYKETLASKLPLALGNAGSGTRTYAEHVIQLDINLDADLGDTTPVLFRWIDLPYDVKRNGSSGNSEAEVSLYYTAKATAKYKSNSLTANAPVINDREGNPISSLEATPKMLFLDLTSKSGNSIMVHEFNMWGVVPYVTETAFRNKSQKSISSRDYITLDKSDGLFGNIIYVVGNSENTIEDFDIYLPIPKEDDTNKNALGNQTDKSEFGLDFYTIDLEELETVAENVTVSYAIASNPGYDGYDSMSTAEWKEAIPSDLSSITGIKIHMKTLQAGATEPIRIQYKLSKDKEKTGTQTAYQTFYYRYKLNGEYITTTTPSVEKYILEDMAINGFVWDETRQEPNSIYDKGSDKLKSGVTLGLYKKDGVTLVEQPSDDKMCKTSEDGTYTLLTPVDGEYIVKIATPTDANETWGLVIKEKSNDTSINSRANQRTGKTDVLKLASNYLRDEYSLENVNFGIYQQAKFENIEDVLVHAGEKATASNIKLIGNTMSLGEDTKTELRNLKDPSVVELELASSSNSLAILAKGLKAGKTSVEVCCTDSYGNEIKDKLDVYSYIRIKYDITTNGGTGTASDANMYYINEQVNGLLMANTSGSLIPDEFIANAGDGVVPPTGEMLVGWSANKDATNETFDIQKGEAYSIPDNTTKDILLYAIYGSIDVRYTIEYYRQISGQPSGVETSYEHYIGGDTIEGDTQSIGSVGSMVKAPTGYETKFGSKYKFNETMSNAELQKTIAADGTTVVKLYYDIVTRSSDGGGSSGGGGSSTGKHAANPVNPTKIDEANGDKGHAELVEPKPDNNRYKNWVWGFMPKTGEEAAKMGAMLLAMAGLIAVITSLVFRRKKRK